MWGVVCSDVYVMVLTGEGYNFLGSLQWSKNVYALPYISLDIYATLTINVKTSFYRYVSCNMGHFAKHYPYVKLHRNDYLLMISGSAESQSDSIYKIIKRR